MVAVRLSQQEQPHHCHGTGEIADGRHICGLLVRAWYQALCQNAAENVVARQRPVGTGAVCNMDAPATSACQGDAASGRPVPDGRDLLETHLLWLSEAHAHAPEAGRVRIRPGPRRMSQIGTRRQRPWADEGLW